MFFVRFFCVTANYLNRGIIILSCQYEYPNSPKYDRWMWNDFYKYDIIIINNRSYILVDILKTWLVLYFLLFYYQIIFSSFIIRYFFLPPSYTDSTNIDIIIIRSRIFRHEDETTECFGVETLQYVMLFYSSLTKYSIIHIICNCVYSITKWNLIST